MTGTAALQLSRVTAALEATWTEIRRQHPDVPDAVIVVGSGSAEGSGLVWGHYAVSRWHIPRGKREVAEVLVSGEGLERGADDVLVTLLHEAAHGAADTRGVKDTSRRGQYHNARFAGIAREFGLTPEQDRRIGWSPCTLAEGTQQRYAKHVEALAAEMLGFRRPERAGRGGGKGGASEASRNGVRAFCGCNRSFRIARSMLTQGPIVCGCCDEPFGMRPPCPNGCGPLPLVEGAYACRKCGGEWTEGELGEYEGEGDEDE